jgi:hypothetical protein
LPGLNGNSGYGSVGFGRARVRASVRAGVKG